jgi:hypothetical protein
MIMKTNHYVVLETMTTILIALLLTAPARAYAHCDGLDGPVVKAAQKALETGNVNLVLGWVQKRDEAEISKAFQKTLAVRQLSAEAKQLADMYFFETLVRIHRAGEGAPYTGLKPAGRDLGPAIPTADKALENGKLEPVYTLLADAMHDGLHARFEEAMAKKNYKVNDLEAGREYVEAYVTFLHYVEPLYQAAKSIGSDHHQHEVEDIEHSKDVQ